MSSEQDAHPIRECRERGCLVSHADYLASLVVSKQRSRSVNEDRVYRMWRAQKKTRAREDWNVRGAVYDVARRFGITCAEVRSILERRRQMLDRL